MPGPPSCSSAASERSARQSRRTQRGSEMDVPPVLALAPSGWAMRFDGARESGHAIAERLWPHISAEARAQRWAFQKDGSTTWSNPDPNRGPLSGEAGDWVAYYGT